MTNLRRLMGIPRLPIRIYVLILALLLVFAYIVTGPVHQLFVKAQSNLGSFYEPTGLEREEYLKAIEQKKQ